MQCLRTTATMGAQEGAGIAPQPPGRCDGACFATLLGIGGSRLGFPTFCDQFYLRR
jgi:hypothetical protein